MRCPFHCDRAASGSYNTSLERFRCHGCDIHGDGYDLIQAVERCDFRTALERARTLATFRDVPYTASANSGRSKLTSRKTKDRARLVRQRVKRPRLQGKA